MPGPRIAALIAIIASWGTGVAAGAFQLIHVEDLAALIAARPQRLWIYDANPPSVRRREGVIPGARLLSSSNHFDVAELPPAKDDKLVFYCANTH
ncbi:MAG: hypothetical protein HYY35_09930 [Deltaproteobacteria bacterium]|nr:hypothetical protein [Deltaproteobacteria bacterium]